MKKNPKAPEKHKGHPHRRSRLRGIGRAVADTAVRTGAHIASAVDSLRSAVHCPALFTPDRWCGDGDRPRRLHLRRFTDKGITIRLQCAALRRWKAARADLKREGIAYHYGSGSLSSYRSCALQRATCERICGNPNGCPGLCADARGSAHPLGLGLDVCASKYHDNARFQVIMQKHGWHQPLPGSDPCHHSCGIDR